MPNNHNKNFKYLNNSKIANKLYDKRQLDSIMWVFKKSIIIRLAVRIVTIYNFVVRNNYWLGPRGYTIKTKISMV